MVLDCAHGAASEVGPRALRDAGAEVVAICAEPDGLNINDGCGSTHLEVLQQAVVEHGADVGFALDGDADRCLAVDAQGEVVDGDQILAILALAMREAGELHDDTVVATVMSNLGFVQAMKAAGVGVRQTKVGDRYVLEAMKLSGFTLGGEQSGHVIMSRHATTGDGILTALHVLDRMAATGRSLADLGAVMTRLPQVLVNVPDVDKARADEDFVLAAAVAEAEAELGDTGRVLLRPSGTEPLVRVMVEAATAEQAQQIADRLAEVVGAAARPACSCAGQLQFGRAPGQTASGGVKHHPSTHSSAHPVRRTWAQPQTSWAVSTTRRSLAISSSWVRALPSTVEEKPHWGERQSCSRGTYFAASSIRRLRSSLLSSSGRLVVTRPSTTCLPSGTKRRGSKPPERSSSYSRKKPSTSSSLNSASATKS